MPVNDGFCDICQCFKGHEDLKTLTGIFFCEDCREAWSGLSRQDRIDGFRRILNRPNVAVMDGTDAK